LVVKIYGLVMGGLVLCVGGAANAAVYHYVFPLDGAQGAVVTPGYGTGDVTLDTTANTLAWNVTFADLLAPVTASHFHGPAAPGVNAGVRVGISAISGLASPMVGSAPITDAFETEIISGLWYVNVHTTLYPGGEIRGQVVPEPAALTLLALGAAAALHRRRGQRRRIARSGEK
jgi:hypothetical protein